MSILKTGNTDFCTECRKWVPYVLRGGTIKKIDGTMYTIPITDAVCTVCGAYISPPGLMDLNTEEFCTWYETKLHKPINRGNSAC